MKNIRNSLWGVILIAIGVIIGLNSFGITEIDLFFDGWWTLFIIVPSFIGLFNDDDKTGNFIGLLIGASLLLMCQGFITFDIILKLFIPVILVVIGISIIFKDNLGKKVNDEIKKINSNQKDGDYCSTFSSQNINFDGQKFEGAELTAIFGGIKCDLREAIIKKDVVINTCSIFGGIDIRVPKDVKVVTKSTSLFGGIDNKAKTKTDEKSYTIYINGTTVFGGVDVK